MLASTVQFSKYGKSPHNPSRQPRQPGRYEKHEALPEETVARSLRTQQRAYDPVPTTDPVPHPPKEAVLGTRHEPVAELVSVPPSSSVTNTRDPPKMRNLLGPRTALDHPHRTNPAQRAASAP